MLSDIQWLPIKGGAFAQVDAEDYHRLSQWSWTLTKYGYVARAATNKEKQSGSPHLIILSRFILGVTSELDVHHINENKLDNRKENLQPMTNSEHGKEHQRRRHPTSFPSG